LQIGISGGFLVTFNNYWIYVRNSSDNMLAAIEGDSRIETFYQQD